MERALAKTAPEGPASAATATVLARRESDVKLKLVKRRGVFEI